MKNLFNLPNVLTLCNLICGCLAINGLYSTGLELTGLNKFEIAIFYMIAAAVFDFFDGFAAKLLKISSPIGKQLDSLADVVTFGVLPGMIAYHFLKDQNSWYSFTALLIPICSALRLAKFNVDERQSLGFIGLPTPANALFFASLVLLDIPHLREIILIMIPLFCYFMISEMPLFALKFTNFSFKGNEIKYIFLLLSLVLILVLFIQAMPFIIILYLLLSLINNKITKHEVQSGN